VLALGCPIGLVAGGAVLTGFMLAKPKMKAEIDMNLHVKAKLRTKVLLAVAWSLVGCSTPRRQEERAAP
jgi:hypothetical protein